MPKNRNGRLAALRTLHDYTQRDMSELAKMSTTRYWALENGYSLPTEDERARLAQLFRVRVRELGFPGTSPRGSKARPSAP